MHSLLRHFTAGGPVLTDGAWGTQLAERGLPPGACPDAWNLSHPDAVEAVARSYVDAGSQVILTNTFRANRLALGGTDLAGDILRINRAGVEISRRAAQGRAAVFASIGPSGRLLFGGQVTVDELRAAFEDQAQALAEAGAEALVIETMSDLGEATAAIAAARTTGLAVIACMVFDAGKARDRTLMGDSPEVVARELAAAGADVIGANCGQGVEQYIEVCRRLRSATDRPIWIKPNAGLPQFVDGEIRYLTTPAQFAVAAERLVDAGANFVGGCCGTGPDYIAAVRSRLLGRHGRHGVGQGAAPHVESL